jgi:hypothetical protein
LRGDNVNLPLDISSPVRECVATMLPRLPTALVPAAFVLTGCRGTPVSSHAGYSHFTGVTDFSNFSREQNSNNEVVLLSPKMEPPIEWDQLVLSWNAQASPGTFLKVEARAFQSRRATKFYSWGVWSTDNKTFPRMSAGDQRDNDGEVRVDTLALNRPANTVQIRITLGGTNGLLPRLKFLGVSFCHTEIAPSPLEPNRAAWGTTIPMPELSQRAYTGGNGWCSPTSVSMVLERWGAASSRTDWKVEVPGTAAAVLDRHFKFPTGNWSFNTAFAGSFDGMRAYVTRFSDISELEDWIAAGIPVIISARWDLLQDGRPDDFNGHLSVCRGFTENGDLVINDPWTDITVESVRHIYKRENVRRAWKTSHNTVYLVYPENVKPPSDRFGHW